jgi:CRISPR-associated protein Cas2
MIEHLFIVSYDIAEPKRWRKIYKMLHGYGDWLQLSVFQCRLSRKRRVQMEALLSDYLNHREDHLLILDFGPADAIKPHVRSIGKPFVPVNREAVIV